MVDQTRFSGFKWDKWILTSETCLSPKRSTVDEGILQDAECCMATTREALGAIKVMTFTVTHLILLNLTYY